MKPTEAIAVALLTVNVVLLSTFGYSVVTETPNVQPWAAIDSLVCKLGDQVK